MSGNVIVCTNRTLIVRVTGVAGAFPPLPAWLAVTTQFPVTPTRVRVLPVTVQTEAGVAVNETGRPLGAAVAISEIGPASGATGPG